MKKTIIPGTITSLNLLSGFFALYTAFHNQFELAIYFVLAGAFFDFLDGFTARMINAVSPIGIQLDSFADIVTFGIAPVSILVNALEMAYIGYNGFNNSTQIFVFAPVLIAVFSAVRLAKFNISHEQTDKFLGIPTPANAIFWVSFGLWITVNPKAIHWSVVLLIILVMSSLLISNVKLLNLKVLKGTNRYFLFILAMGSIVFLIKMQLMAGVLIIPFYVFLSLIRFYIVRR